MCDDIFVCGGGSGREGKKKSQKWTSNVFKVARTHEARDVSFFFVEGPWDQRLDDEIRELDVSWRPLENAIDMGVVMFLDAHKGRVCQQTRLYLFSPRSIAIPLS